MFFTFFSMCILVLYVSLDQSNLGMFPFRYPRQYSYLRCIYRFHVFYLRFDARDDVTTVPALAAGGDPSADAKLLRGVDTSDNVSSEMAEPRLPGEEKMYGGMKDRN